uniref:MIP31873p n=1 Tax=Drosophila melanogaster TaxID=7227 RepID=F7VJS7_DROME|eukprot:NP_001245678.1 uncharacterized protein Dmel_CG43076 [Drosophila melanogaster]
MSSIEWIADMLFYAMRTYLKMTAPSCDAHFLINALGKIEHLIHFIEFSIMIIRRPRNLMVLTNSRESRLQLRNCLSMLRTWAQVIYALLSVLALIHIKTIYISIALLISGIVLFTDMIFMAINGVHGRRTLRPAQILWISLCCCTWVPWILDEMINYLYK